MKPIRPRAIIAAALISGLLTSIAGAASLKSEVTVYSNVVIAKDLFNDAGKYANEPLFLAPDIGETGRISANRVATEAHNAGIYDIRLNGIETVTVHRPSQKIGRDDILLHLKDTISKTFKSDIDFEITTTSIPEVTHADARKPEALKIADLKLFENENRFQATVQIETYAGPSALPVRGVITEMQTIAVLTRDVKRDEVLGPGDVIDKRVPKERVRPGTISSLEGLVGKAVTRNLANDSPLREQDVIEPLVIRSNDLVTITYAIPGLLLTVQGRALDSGANNAVISVMNLQSKRIIRGRVTEKGEVVVEVRKPLLATNDSPADPEVQ